jgi:uncharacterized LabA/DUF88 family protein
VTTQNTHHEHNDVDQSVVEYPSASKTTTVDSTTSEKRLSPEIQGETAPFVNEQASTPSTTEPDTKVPSASNQTQKPSENPVSSEIVNQADASPDIQATSETSIPHKTVTHVDKTLQAEVEPVATPGKAQTQGEAQPNTQEVKYGEAEQNRSADGAGSEEKRTQTETRPSEQSLPTEETQTAVGKASLLTVSSSVSMSVTAQQSEQTQPVRLPQATGRAAFNETDETSALSEHPKEASSPLPYKEIAPLINTTAEEVRPFTQFIEEFRLAEAARLQSALREPQVEAFGLLNSVETISSEDTSTGKPVTTENREGTEITEGTGMHAEAKQSTNTEPKDTSATEQKTLTNPANRPVSPLLRPATRLRVPRHGLVRHQREEQQTDEVTLPVVQKTQAEIKDTGATLPSAPVSEPVPPKPARRYRFDRPSSNTTHVKNAATVSEGTTTSILPNSNESMQSTAPAAVVKDSSTQDKDTLEVHSNTATTLEAPTPAQEQEEVSPEARVLTEPTTSAQTSEQGRRRQIHKEQPASTSQPVVEPPTLAGESTTSTDEIAPEDLPPLEYSELQKAGPSRRRRRHRSGTSSITSSIGNMANEPATPVTPVPSSPSTLLSSQTPPYPNPTNGVYNIVSGYTLNQMNQGNEVVGPFMGPEPSPARGSVITRESRPTRAETQRTPIAPSSFTSRSAEHGLHTPSAASMTQFANIVSQAIQAQTDRMVAELRRANQAPANVSVNLPPFPSTERVGVFVDVANLLYSARTLRIAVDFGKLLDFLRGNRRLVRAHAYCPTSPQPGDEQMFLQAVKGLGYRITTKNYKTFSSGAKKADLDLDLCMDVVRLVDGRAVDCVVLVSGDSDFMPMLDYCSDHGIRVEVAAFDEAMSATLRQSCDLFVNLSMLEEIRA